MNMDYIRLYSSLAVATTALRRPGNDIEQMLKDFEAKWRAFEEGVPMAERERFKPSIMKFRDAYDEILAIYNGVSSNE